MKKKKECIVKEIENIINNLILIYKSMNNDLLIDDKFVNMDETLVKRISLKEDVHFYFAFLNAVYEYRDSININAIPAYQNVARNKLRYIFTEYRLKNINSISSKIYQYIHIKNEKGTTPINKCINDTFGIRILVPIRSIDTIKELLENLKNKNEWKCKVIKSIKEQYAAVHMYIYSSSHTFRWEIQFWPIRRDAKNRASHAKHKQNYTNWESLFNPSDLIEVIDCGNNI